jgi:hypothetical protein
MEEEENDEIFNIFYSNFSGNNEKQIKSIYEIEKKKEENDIISKTIITEIYKHPLFLNYNYCLFCLERRKTKYNKNNLKKTHMDMNLNEIKLFMQEKNISLKVPQNTNEKLAKRRFIKSEEHKNKISNNRNENSDTELYIQKKNKKEKRKKRTPKKNNNKRRNTKLLSSKHKDMFKLNKNKSIEEEEDKSVKLKVSKTIFRNQTSKNIDRNINDSSKSNKDIDLLLHKKTSNEQKNKNNNIISIFGKINNYFNEANDTNQNLIDDKGEIATNLEYFEKNEKCEICLDEIKYRYTLFCGDFFCKDCVIKLIKECIDDVSLFDKMVCPKCSEPINETTIKFLLDKKYFKKYKILKRRIEGLQNKNYIPCPHPDCECFALKDYEQDKNYKCHNGHIFCKKCNEELDNNPHVCFEKYKENLVYLKNNKNIRKCPQCKSWVERIPEGCNYFTCSNIWCKYQFCWICGQKYEPSHYLNPFSACFRLRDSDYQSKVASSMNIRRIRCVLILLLLSIVVFVFFSFLAISFYYFYYHFDITGLRTPKLRSPKAKKAFYVIFGLFVLCLSTALIPFGYMLLVLFILSIPIMIIYSKVKKKDSSF